MKVHNVEKSIPKIIAWLQAQGAEILPNTSSHEALRFKGSEVGVIYKSGKTSGTYAIHMLVAFSNGTKWDGAPVSTGRESSYKKYKALLLKRDGTKCCFCDTELGEDITLEHWIPLTAGGLNILSNMALAHGSCNQSQGFKPLNEKIAFAIKMRSLM